MWNVRYAYFIVFVVSEVSEGVRAHFFSILQAPGGLLQP